MAGHPRSLPCTPPARGPGEGDTGALGLRGPGLGSQSSARWLRAQGHISWGRKEQKAVLAHQLLRLGGTGDSCLQEKCLDLASPPVLGGLRRQHSLWVRRASPVLCFSDVGHITHRPCLQFACLRITTMRTVSSLLGGQQSAGQRQVGECQPPSRP